MVCAAMNSISHSVRELHIIWLDSIPLTMTAEGRSLWCIVCVCECFLPISVSYSNDSWIFSLMKLWSNKKGSIQEMYILSFFLLESMFFYFGTTTEDQLVQVPPGHRPNPVFQLSIWGLLPVCWSTTVARTHLQSRESWLQGFYSFLFLPHF